VSAAASEEEAVQQRQEEREAQVKEAEGDSCLLIMSSSFALTSHAHTLAELRFMLSMARRKRRRPGMCCQVATEPCLAEPC
jgi:hypothetical protein